MVAPITIIAIGNARDNAKTTVNKTELHKIQHAFPANSNGFVVSSLALWICLIKFKESYDGGASSRFKINKISISLFKINESYNNQ